MFMRKKIMICLIVIFGLIQVPLTGQSVWERLKKAAEDAAKNPEQKRPDPRQPPKPGIPSTPATKLTPSSAKVEATILAPSQNGLQFYVSPRGGHLAAITQRGSRFVVLRDGAEGPQFDEILGDEPYAKGKIIFSDDGLRFAYVGRLAQEYVVMVDGKELVRFPVATTVWSRNRGGALPDFTPLSKHTYFSVYTTRPSGDLIQFFFDSQPVVTNSRTMSGLVLSPDGDRYAFIAGNVNDKEWTLVVDGKTAGYQGMAPQFTSDGKHLFTKSFLPAGQGVAVLLDGNPFIRAQDVRLYIAPVGYGVVAAVTRRDPGKPSTQFLEVNGKKIEGSDSAQIGNVWFSPDGKHYAADCQTSSLSHFVVVDGKKEQEYRSLTALVKLKGPNVNLFTFSADSARRAYIGHSGNKDFAVIDDIESDGYATISSLSFGGAGKRVGFVGWGINNRERWIVVDGKTTQRNGASDDLVFSDDGSRYAYTLNESGVNGSFYKRLVVDGVVQEDSSILPMYAGQQEGIDFLFTADGKHVVHYGTTISSRKMGFFVDGKFVVDPFGIRPGSPTFTPDGRHLLWFQMLLGELGRPAGFVIYVDGRPAQQVDHGDDNFAMMTKIQGGWTMGSDGVLTFIARAGDAVKRFRITPSDDTSIETLLSSAMPARGRS
jgi:hypothetical protein